MNLAKGKFIKNKQLMLACLSSIILVVGIGVMLVSKADSYVGIKYKSHVAHFGWLKWQANGTTSGTTGQSRRLEAIKIMLTGEVTGTVKYRAYIRDIGWQDWVADGKVAGSEGKSKPMDAIKICLNGEITNSYDVRYRVHIKNKGWQNWVSNGEIAGMISERLRIEAIEIKLVEKEKQEATGITGTSQFTKYQLTDSQLRGIASLCQQEQGSAQGAAAEASLMANHMDLRHNNARKYPNTGTGLYDYVRNGGWFAYAAKHMDEQHDLRTDVLNAVKTVLVEGKRTLPGYVNEHDCFLDINSATNNGVAINVKDRNSYVKNQTIMNNRYGSTYIFYCFPTTKSDPFGYISEEKRNEIGDFCYTYSAEEYEK